MYEDFTLLIDGREAFPEILWCIRHAEKSIYINMFIWRDDAIGNELARAVLEAAERGVQVCISADRYGAVLEKSEEAKKSFFHKKLSPAERAKVRTLEWLYPMPGAPEKAEDEESELYRAIMGHPNVTVSADVFKADHSKYYIFDGEILILGGINIEDKENGQDMQGRVYQDYMVKLVGQNYVQALRTKLKGGENTADEWFFGVNCKEPARRFEMEEHYLTMIRQAKTRLHITMAYFSPLEPFLKAIADAHERGVAVSVVIPERANYQNDSNRKAMRRLFEMTHGGAAIYLSPKMVHTKLMISDDHISFGSTNITKKAFGQLSELNLCVKHTDSPFVRRLRESVEENLALCTKVEEEGQLKYNRLLGWLEGFLV